MYANASFYNIKFSNTIVKRWSIWTDKWLNLIASLQNVSTITATDTTSLRWRV